MEASTWSVEKSIPQELRDHIQTISSTPRSGSVHSNLYVFLRIIYQLKSTPRTGWLNFDVPNPESISDHMYRMGIISMLSNNKELDTGRCVKMALVHDMAEALVGDITPFDPITKEEKHRREYETMKYLTGTLLTPFNPTAAEEIMTLWNEYEHCSSPESRFVKDVDKFELLVQTLEYEQLNKAQKDLGQFMGVYQQIKSPEVQAWADDILAQRKHYWETTANNI